MLQENTGADTMTEVVRRALAVYDYLWEQKTQGAKVMVQRGDDPPKELVLL